MCNYWQLIKLQQQVGGAHAIVTLVVRYHQLGVSHSIAAAQMDFRNTIEKIHKLAIIPMFVCALEETKCAALLQRSAFLFAFHLNWTFGVHHRCLAAASSYTFSTLIHLVGYASSSYFLFISIQASLASFRIIEWRNYFFFQCKSRLLNRLYVCPSLFSFHSISFEFLFGFQTILSNSVGRGALRN